jgi:hypothetical protein
VSSGRFLKTFLTFLFSNPIVYILRCLKKAKNARDLGLFFATNYFIFFVRRGTLPMCGKVRRFFVFVSRHFGKHFE